MREIKFRQKIKKPFPFTYNEVFHYWGYIDGDFVSPMGKNDGEVESQQFTGEKDKNGVDIYEGDIVRYRGGSGSERYGQVLFNTNQYPSLPAFHICDKEGDSVDYYYGLANFEDCEVVGNNYENPELLEK